MTEQGQEGVALVEMRGPRAILALPVALYEPHPRAGSGGALAGLRVGLPLARLPER